MFWATRYKVSFIAVEAYGNTCYLKTLVFQPDKEVSLFYKGKQT